MINPPTINSPYQNTFQNILLTHTHINNNSKNTIEQAIIAKVLSQESDGVVIKVADQVILAKTSLSFSPNDLLELNISKIGNNTVLQLINGKDLINNKINDYFRLIAPKQDRLTGLLAHITLLTKQKANINQYPKEIIEQANLLVKHLATPYTILKEKGMKKAMLQSGLLFENTLIKASNKLDFKATYMHDFKARLLILEKQVDTYIKEIEYKDKKQYGSMNKNTEKDARKISKEKEYDYTSLNPANKINHRKSIVRVNHMSNNRETNTHLNDKEQNNIENNSDKHTHALDKGKRDTLIKGHSSSNSNNIFQPQKNSPMLTQAQLQHTLSLSNNNLHTFRELRAQLSESIARIHLNQLSSINLDVKQDSNFIFELPLYQNEKIDLFNIHINQQEVANKNNQSKNKKRWTATLTFDLESLGPMKVQILINEDKISTLFWGESHATVKEINKYISEFHNRMHAAGLEIDILECQQGIINQPEVINVNIKKLLSIRA